MIEVVMSLPATALRHRWAQWKVLWGLGDLSLILAPLWGDLNARLLLPVKCMWAMTKLYTAFQGWPFPPLKLFHLFSNNSSPGWRRWGLEVRAFMWEYRDLRQSSQGETLCVACDIITHFLSGMLVFTQVQITADRGKIWTRVSQILSEYFNLSALGGSQWAQATFPGCVFCRHQSSGSVQEQLHKWNGQGTSFLWIKANLRCGGFALQHRMVNKR